MVRWCSLFLPFADPTLPMEQIAAERLRESLTAMGYTLYDPFGLIPGRAYPSAIKLFVMPRMGNWIGVISAVETESYTAKVGLAQTIFGADPFSLALLIGLDDPVSAPESAMIDVWEHGEPADPRTALIPYLKPGVTPDDLDAALSLTDESSPAPTEPTVLTLLPEQVKSLADGVNERQAQQLINRLSSNVMGKLGGAPANAADILKSSAPDWNSPAGKRVIAAAACLTLPETWKTLDFLAVRDAYALARRFERFPNANRLPGDQAALDTVPNALDFIPVYGGKG